MSSADPGVTDGVTHCCLYCQSTDDTLYTFLPCGHIICRACREGSTSSSVVRVISPHGLTPLPSATDHKCEAGQCVFCSAAVRTSKVATSILDMLRCVSCGGVCQNACEVVCGHCMCEPCAQYVCRTTSVCPACQQPLQVQDIDPVRVLRRRVNDLAFVCKYGVYGCVESGKVEGLSQHEAQCEYGERLCEGCGRCVKRNAWDHHLAECTALHIDCPHLCGARLRRSDMAMHALQCEYGVVVCDLPACDHRTQRRYLAHHQADMAFHLRLLSHSFQHNLRIQQDQQQLNRQWQDSNTELRTQLDHQQQIITQLQGIIEQQAADMNGLQARNRHLQQQVEQLQQQLQRQEDFKQQLQLQCDTLQQQLCEFKQDLHVAEKQEEKEEKQEEKQKAKNRDIISIGGSVRHLPVFDEPTTCYGVAVAGGFLYLSHNYVVDVVDAASGGRVARWGAFNQRNRAVVGHPPYFQQPYGVAVDEKRGRVYVADTSYVVVVRLCDGIVEALWAINQLSNPRSLAYCPTSGLLYVVDGSNHLVVVLRGSDGRRVQTLGTKRGKGSNELDSPQGVAVDQHHIYIADFRNNRVIVYSKQTGEFLFQLGQFHQLRSVSVDSETGAVFVADYWNCRVCVYRDGSYVGHLQVLQTDNTKVKPSCVMWDAAAGVLYVACHDSTTICVYGC